VNVSIVYMPLVVSVQTNPPPDVQAGVTAKLAVTDAPVATAKPNDDVPDPEGHADDASPVQVQPEKVYPGAGVSETVAVEP
jgi:hypothetical protein